jgi:hypothetical protein
MGYLYDACDQISDLLKVRTSLIFKLPLFTFWSFAPWVAEKCLLPFFFFLNYIYPRSPKVERGICSLMIPPLFGKQEVGI